MPFNNLKNIKKNIVRMAHYSGASHVSSALSVADILYVLYFKIVQINIDDCKNMARDRVILSKGHASTALYATLAERGLMEKEKLSQYYVDGGVLPGHLDREVSDFIDASTGSLGHGPSLGLGLALGRPGSNVYVIVGDGECAEGAVWEAIMLAGQLKLVNFTLIIDNNGLQGFGYSKDIIDTAFLAERIRPFGFEVFELDGHDCKALEAAFKHKTDKPKAIIAHTIKGNGVSFMENALEWHYKSPNNEELLQALNEIDASE